MKTYIGQVAGPFAPNNNIGVRMLTSPSGKIFNGAFKLGIISKPYHKVLINGVEIEIGKTGMYEVRGTKITSVVFSQWEDKNTMIDFMISVE